MICQVKLPMMAAVALGAGVLFTAPGSANPSGTDEPILVKTGTPMQKWQDRVSSDLNAALQDRAPFRETDDDAIVQIAFTLDQNGKPANLRFYNEDGDRTTRSHAMSAIRNLKSLADVPVANRDDVNFLANIIFSTDARQHKKLTERLEQMESVRLASSKRADRTFVALGDRVVR